MATKKVKRSVHKKQSAEQKKKSGARSQKSVGSKARPKSARYAPGEFALRERTLPGRRFVEFPLVQGKIADKVQLFTATNFHSLTIEFQDRTSLHLDIEPGFTVNAQFMRLEKGELVTLAEWPPIHISSERR